MSGLAKHGNQLTDQIHRRAAELLRGGEWHDSEQVLRDLMRLVPPGVAIRRNERARLSKRNPEGGKPPAERKQRQPTDKLIKFGARAVVRELLVNSGVYELDGDKIRMIGKSRTVRGDELRGTVLLPVLEELARTFEHAEMDWSLEQVRLAAHDQGLHLSLCPQGCRLGGPLPSQDIHAVEDQR